MMIMLNNEFPTLPTNMYTSQKKISPKSGTNSNSPKSHSTQDNSFERDLKTQAEEQDYQDQLFECLVGYFDHKVLTPIQCDSQNFPQVNEIRGIFDQLPIHNYMYMNPFMLLPPIQRQNYMDLNIYEDKILQDERTTLMIKNIPKDITPAKLKADLDTLFKNQFNFIYMPFEQTTNTNQGYAFVNFLTPLIVLKFYQKYNGQSWSKSHTDKVCILKYAKQQGKRDIINQMPN